MRAGTVTMSEVSTAAKTPAAGAAASARPSVISLAIRERGALVAAYMPFVQGGGLFVPTTRTANLGDDLYLILTLLDDPTKFAVQGKVVWITPPGSTGRQQGIGIQFAKTDAGEQVRAKIEELVGAAQKTSKATHTV